jgi:transcriptional regulator with GAF, ATPase, and Fis domain
VFLATNRDLDSLVREGKFREDLYWRIGELVLRLPPLREQAERIPVLAQSLVAEILSRHEASGVELTLTQADLRWAQSQAWPGNVRELRRTVWRWAYEEGRVPLAAIHMEYRTVGGGLRPEAPSVKALVRQRLASALESKTPLASSVGEFVGEFDAEIKRGLYALKNEMELNRRTLGTLFGDGNRAAKQISAWGKGVRSS